MSLRKSTWKFDTSWGGGGSVGFLAATLGSLYFKDPSGLDIEFSYIAGGVGLGFGIKGIKASGAVSTTEHLSAGTLYMLPSFHGDELKKDDISGICVFVDGGASLGPGFSRAVMFLGGDIRLVPFAMLPATSDGHQDYIKSFKAMASLKFQLTGIGGGVYAYGGYLGSQEKMMRSEGIWKVQANGNTFYYTFLPANQIEWATDEHFTNIKGTGNYIMNKDFMRINWRESGDYEEWSLPLNPTGQTGTWHPKPKGDGRFLRYAISAEKISG